MFSDVLDLGCGPANEPCAQLGEGDYRDRAIRECRAFIQAIRRVCGEEPEGASLQLRSNPHDFGTYYSVCCRYDGDSEAAAAYAARCDRDAPTTWEEANMTAPTPPEPERGR